MNDIKQLKEFIINNNPVNEVMKESDIEESANKVKNAVDRLVTKYKKSDKSIKITIDQLKYSLDVLIKRVKIAKGK